MSAASTATNSAWAKGRGPFGTDSAASAITTPFRTTTAPTGMFPAARAASARPAARAIHLASLLAGDGIGEWEASIARIKPGTGANARRSTVDGRRSTVYSLQSTVYSRQSTRDLRLPSRDPRPATRDPRPTTQFHVRIRRANSGARGDIPEVTTAFPDSGSLPSALTADACVRALAARDARFDGLFFVGITSTRIYCRPICPARVSHTDRRRFFGSAAAAERAGFRPCLRCRPELAPGRCLLYTSDAADERSSV